jgi:CheY-like chemotaxis protein
MKTVLVVEDEHMTQRTYQAGLRGLMDWKVIVVEHGMAALRVLEETRVNVLVTDLDMPHLSGHDLIQTTRTWYPDIPILVVSGVQDSASLDAALQSGAMRIHPKPIRLSWLMDEIRGLSDRPPDGRAEGIPLASMLQMIHWERSECTLTVQSDEQLGRLYVRNGDLVQASFRGQRGLEGALAILDLPHPKLEFVRTCRVDRAIQMPIEEILMEHSLRKDHAKLSPDEDLERWGKG